MISPIRHAILRHCLGFHVNPRHARDPEIHRNYYCAEPGTQDHSLVSELVASGYMEREKGRCYRATAAGIAVARMSYEAYRDLVGIILEKEGGAA